MYFMFRNRSKMVKIANLKKMEHVLKLHMHDLVQIDTIVFVIVVGGGGL